MTSCQLLRGIQMHAHQEIIILPPLARNARRQELTSLAAFVFRYFVLSRHIYTLVLLERSILGLRLNVLHHFEDFSLKCSQKCPRGGGGGTPILDQTGTHVITFRG